MSGCFLGAPPDYRINFVATVYSRLPRRRMEFLWSAPRVGSLVDVSLASSDIFSARLGSQALQPWAIGQWHEGRPPSHPG